MNTRRVTSVLLLIVPLHACSSWRPITASPTQLIVEGQPRRVRVTDSSGSRQTIERPIVRGDSIVNSVGEECTASSMPGEPRRCDGERTATSLNDVELVEVERPSMPKTLGAILLGSVALIVGAFAASGGWSS